MSGGVRAVGLLSGGLDSTLAARIMKEQGVEVDAVNFYTGFCIVEHRRKMGRSGRGGRNEALRAGADIEVSVDIVDIFDEYLSMVAHPRFGYGSAINPCIDCRILMLKNARLRMESTGAKFVFTGEVLGQRPMSQHKNQLRLIEKESGLEGLLLRPLSAKLLPPTLPETEGWVDREMLYGISGRGRKEQFVLAEQYGIVDYPQPAGGCCFLTDKNYAAKLKDLYAHKGKDSVTKEDVILLKVGRHFRISETAKVIVGRDEGENNFLESYVDNRWVFMALDFEGPLTLVEGDISADEKRSVAAITARYSDGKNQNVVRVEWRYGGESGVLEVEPAGNEIDSLRV
ncbi:thiamine biosynthesis protein [candidate division TA06 bacterium]|uniref:Thiamine biosynthesis protein n=1 Tax=candidate division TA06 bacterium TaxID=2250710 RepID=A0A523XU26_UNCT6|nr:MAG: thiamine biosynthesis protein [candidate division TA06 bacterium]